MYTVWAGMEKYVKRVVNEVYASDEAVAADQHLQGVARDMGRDGAHLRGTCWWRAPLVPTRDAVLAVTV